MGPYCNFCNRRCFVHIPVGIPKEIEKTTDLMATCPGGQRFELEKTGWNYDKLTLLLQTNTEIH